MENIEYDEDGFPVPSWACLGTLFTDEYGVVWTFQYTGEEFGWCWVTLGKSKFGIPREDGDDDT